MDVLIGAIGLVAGIVFFVVMADEPPHRHNRRSTRTRHPKRVVHKWRVK